MTRFLMAETACGAWFLRMVEASSRSRTSLFLCSLFSIPQCAILYLRSSAGLACDEPKLVIKQIFSVVTLPLFSIILWLVMIPNCFIPYQRILHTGKTSIFLMSLRPCPDFSSSWIRQEFFLFPQISQ